MTYHFSSNWVSSILLSLGILLTAFGIIYFKDLNRQTFMKLQNLQLAQQQYQSEWGKLLLEESTWSAQERVADLAQKRFGMLMPDAKSVVIMETTSNTVLADNK